MFRKLLFNLSFVFLIGALLLAACAPQGSAPSPVPTDVPVTPAPEEPTSSETPQVGEQPANPWGPEPGDERLNRAEVEVEKTEILALESFPPQFKLQVSGWKGNPCNMLRVEVGDPDEENRIHVEIYTLYDIAATCIQVLESFDIQISLGSYPDGEYTIWLNGEQIGEITTP